MIHALICMTVFLFAQKGDGRIIAGPKDTEAVFGTQLVLRCQTDIIDSANPVEWNFKANDYAAYHTIYKSGLIVYGFRGKMKVETNVLSGHYDLVIFNISFNNAGAYTCLDDDSQQRAEIIVHWKYHSGTICWLTSPSDVILGKNQCNIEPDQIQITCSLWYMGNLKPHLECYNGEQLISSNSSTILFQPWLYGIITSTVPLRADELHSLTFNCRVAYENNMTSMFNWTTTVSVTSTSELTTANNLECNHRQAKCSTLSDFKCNYTWIYDNNMVANESVLRLENLSYGNYTCVATCSIRNTSCQFVAKQIVYTCGAEHNEMENLKLLSLVLITMFLMSRYSDCDSTIEKGPIIHSEENRTDNPQRRSSIADGEQEASVLVAFLVSTNWKTNCHQEQENLGLPIGKPMASKNKRTLPIGKPMAFKNKRILPTLDN